LRPGSGKKVAGRISLRTFGAKSKKVKDLTNPLSANKQGGGKVHRGNNKTMDVLNCQGEEKGHPKSDGALFKGEFGCPFRDPGRATKKKELREGKEDVDEKTSLVGKKEPIAWKRIPIQPPNRGKLAATISIQKGDT